MKSNQLSLFGSSLKQNQTDDAIVTVSFRNLVPHITETTYLTHPIYYYPAKFIPHVVRYCIDTYTKENDVLADPFAGSGTVGLEAYLNRRNAFLLDLNPLLNHIIPIKIYQGKDSLEATILDEMLHAVVNSHTSFIPAWSNYQYWYPESMLETISRYWGGQKLLDKNIYTQIIEASLVKISKHFSYAEHKAPKLFRSKWKQKYINQLLQINWQDELNIKLRELSFDYLKRINQFIAYTEDHQNTIAFFGGIDSSYYQFNNQTQFDIIITSPPYIQAQEYIRTSKMDLYWLGYTDKEVKRLTKLEIPYRKADRIIDTETLQQFKLKLNRDDLTRIVNAYFCHTINAIENMMCQLKSGGHACIFIGNPKVDGIEVEIWRILKEYFIEKGYVFQHVFEDVIKRRQLFKYRKNKNPSGMKSEFLLVLRKR
ncbi:MAG: adenine specific DNA methylase Mod [Anaerolineaceae bacterium 4572_78]|nr:MAG: adenine specific DNA methylase Mod [Anaerolineaceae bacterium 4572_78]